MDFQKILVKVKDAFHVFWLWIKPYLQKIHQWRKRIWKKYHVSKIIVLVSLLAVLIGSGYLFYIAKTTKVSELESGLKASTVIYDSQGEEAGKLYSQKGTYTDLEQISPYVVDALIATEDRNFYSHHGFDIKGIARAAMRLVINRGTSGGGGSTITQQLAKNAYLSLDQTFSRKAKELFLAIEIEKKYSKDEILEMYLNSSYFGNGVWGIQDASLKYFGVNASEVTLGEAATLVGMLKGPSLYNPIDNIEQATNRRDTVLSVMAETGTITQEQETQESQVQLANLVYDGYQQSESGYKYPYYFDAVIDEAVSKYGLDADDIMNRGYKIYTTLDQNKQTQMENTYKNDSLFPENAADGTMVQSGSVALDPNTGGIQALVGRRGEHVFRGFNFATQMKRSPGSTIKPLSVYTPALEAGYTPESILQDTPQSYYEAQNYDGTYSGEVPMYQALAQSLNLPVIWLLHEIGLDKGYEKTQEFGLTLSKSDRYYGLALGGLETGESPMTMAAAYAVFANGGYYYEPYLITKIVDSTGAVIVDKTTPKGKRIISEKTAEQMTSMLLGTFSNGTAVNASPFGYTMAGKTGTTETNFDLTKVNDQWIIGYTPDLVISTWLGFETTSEEHYLTSVNSQGVGRVFKAEAEMLLPYTQGSQFEVADAYQTGGKLMAADEVTQSDDTEKDWQKSVDEFTEKAKDGLQEFGNRVKEGTQELFGGLWNAITGD